MSRITTDNSTPYIFNNSNRKLTSNPNLCIINTQEKNKQIHDGFFLSDRDLPNQNLIYENNNLQEDYSNSEGNKELTDQQISSIKSTNNIYSTDKSEQTSLLKTLVDMGVLSALEALSTFAIPLCSAHTEIEDLASNRKAVLNDMRSHFETFGNNEIFNTSVDETSSMNILEKLQFNIKKTSEMMSFVPVYDQSQYISLADHLAVQQRTLSILSKLYEFHL